MCFNPKIAKLADVAAKDISKAVLKKLAKVAPNEAKAVPFFCKQNNKFADGKEGPLFICGKIKKLKGEYKKLKTADEFSGLVYVKMDDKGIPTTVFMPCLGKLGDKDSVLKKAMKTLFTNAWANYEIGKSIDENAELAAETAADALADDVEVAEDAPNSEAAPAAETKAEDTKADPKAAAPAGKMDKLKSDVEALEALLESMKGNSDASKHGEMDAQFKSLVGDIQKKK